MGGGMERGRGGGGKEGGGGEGGEERDGREGGKGGRREGGREGGEEGGSGGGRGGGRGGEGGGEGRGGVANISGNSRVATLLQIEAVAMCGLAVLCEAEGKCIPHHVCDKHA